ncbi:hypothetical protein C0Q59_30280 [Streptomyces albidoflavus]|nr:hypothetical protein C0Q59_30280 [Streptomyces albidoflavus]
MSATSPRSPAATRSGSTKTTPRCARPRRCSVRAVIPVPTDQRRHRLRRGSRGGRPPGFDRETYEQRNTAERCITRHNQWRSIATRYAKTPTIYLADSTSRTSSNGPPDEPNATAQATTLLKPGGLRELRAVLDQGGGPPARSKSP